MKYTIILSALLILAFASCDKDEKNSPLEKFNQRFDPTATDVLLATDTIVGAEGTGASGTLKLYKNENRQVLRFEDFIIDRGPNQKVYLSRDSGNVDSFVIIGDLLASAGNFNYVFSNVTDVTKTPWVTIYSTDNNSILAWSLLQF